MRWFSDITRKALKSEFFGPDLRHILMNGLPEIHPSLDFRHLLYNVYLDVAFLFVVGIAAIFHAYALLYTILLPHSLIPLYDGSLTDVSSLGVLRLILRHLYWPHALWGLNTQWHHQVARVVV